jgi:hypothetical protein
MATSSTGTLGVTVFCDSVRFTGSELARISLGKLGTIAVVMIVGVK